jgi:RNA polymerase sigma-70 factor (ECF subfamily)
MAPTEDLPIVLIVRAQSGDVRAFEHILRIIEPGLHRYVARIVGAGSADDVLQETFLRMWRGLKWLVEPNVFRAWAFRIATREAQRVLRRERGREAMRAGEAELQVLEAQFRDPAIRLDAERSLMQVTSMARLVLVAHYFEELTLEEISAATGAPVGTVKSRLASGLAHLRAIMGLAK